MTMSDATPKSSVEIDRRALEVLREFADAHATEYGDIRTLSAIIDAGIALEMDDPTPSTGFDYFDPEGLREIYGDSAVDELRERWYRHSPKNSD